MTETLGDRIRRRRQINQSGVAHSAALSAGQADTVKKELQQYVDEQIASLVAKNGLTPP